MRESCLPVISPPKKLKKRQVQLVASGDLRDSANRQCWPEQAKMEAALGKGVADAGYERVGAHACDADRQHGFIASQREGMIVFRDGVDPEAPIVVAEAVWQ